LAAAGVNFIPADFNSVRLAISANPSAFGFEFVDTALGHTACIKPATVDSAWALLCSSDPGAPSTFASPTADQTRLFADNEHLSTAGQKIQADYYYSLIVAPSQISFLAENAVKAATMSNPARAAAEQIAALINSRVQSPRIDEMETIIARAMPTNPLGQATPEMAAAFAEWEAVRVLHDSDVQRSDEETGELGDRLVDKTEALFAVRVRSFADLQFLVPAVVCWNAPLLVGAPGYPESAFADGPDKAKGQDDRSVAHFIRTVRDLLGKVACVDGGPNLSNLKGRG
jgi:hypothetical protein